MENINMTLGNVIRSRGQQTGDQNTEGNITNLSFNTYLTLFGINLTYRFPDVSDLNTINLNTVRNIANFSLGCTSVALDTWEETVGDRQKTIARQSRAA